jgi:hypothetical protein
MNLHQRETDEEVADLPMVLDLDEGVGSWDKCKNRQLATDVNESTDSSTLLCDVADLQRSTQFDVRASPSHALPLVGTTATTRLPEWTLDLTHVFIR